jgi:hypothetical protein
MFRLEAIYKGIKKFEVKNTRERLPITYDILLDICIHLQKGIFSLYTDITVSNVTFGDGDEQSPGTEIRRGVNEVSWYNFANCKFLEFCN